MPREAFVHDAGANGADVVPAALNHHYNSGRGSCSQLISYLKNCVITFQFHRTYNQGNIRPYELGVDNR